MNIQELDAKSVIRSNSFLRETRWLSTGVKLSIVIFHLMVLLSEKAGATGVEEIAAVGSRYARLLDSVEFAIATDGYYDYHYYHEGDKYRVEAFRVKAFGGAPIALNEPDSPAILSKTVYESVYSFDGAKHFGATRKGHEIIRYGNQLSRHKFARLGVSRNPVLLSYAWIMEVQEDYGWSVVCNERAWSEALKNTAVLDDEKVRGLNCVHLVKDTSKNNVHLWLAKDCGFFPIRLDCRSKETGESICERRVLEYRLFDAPSSSDERILIPLKVTDVQFGREKVSAIKEGTLKVNLGIDDDLFTLTPSHNTIAYIDADKHEKELAARMGNPVDLEAEEGRFSVYRILFIAVGLILVLFATVRSVIGRTRTCPK